jgi:hypothetical protein
MKRILQSLNAYMDQSVHFHINKTSFKLIGKNNYTQIEGKKFPLAYMYLRNFCDY